MKRAWWFELSAVLVMISISAVAASRNSSGTATGCCISQGQTPDGFSICHTKPEMFRTAVDQLWGLPVFEEPASPDHHHRARYSCQAHREIEIDFGPCGVASGVAGDHLCRNGKVVLSVGDDILQVKRALLGFRCERKPDSNEQKNVLGYWLGPEDLTVVLAENKVKTLHIFGLMNLHLERQGEYCR